MTRTHLVTVGYLGTEADLDALIDFCAQRRMKFVHADGNPATFEGWPALADRYRQELRAARNVWSDDAAVERAADAISEVGLRYVSALREDEGEYHREAAVAALRAALENR